MEIYIIFKPLSKFYFYYGEVYILKFIQLPQLLTNFKFI